VVGLIQGWNAEHYYEYLSADDVVGVIEATALPFAEDPSNPSSYTPNCPTCTREQYGKGRLNAFGATLALQLYWLEEIERLEDVSIEDAEVFTYHGHTWVRRLVKADVNLGPPISAGSDLMPDYVGWVRRASSNTYPLWKDNQRSLEIAELGITDCYMSLPDEDGNATLTGYLYARVVGEEYIYEGPDGEPLTTPEEVEIHWVRVTDSSAGIPDHEIQGGIQRVSVRESPCGTPVRLAYSLDSPGYVQASLYDVRGRLMRTLDRSYKRAGSHRLLWDGKDSLGRNAPSGFYWLQVGAAGKSVSQRFLLLR
jgi:hypothetical protein